MNPLSKTPAYRARVDVVPVVLEFLGGVRADDVLTELVQNDLDQGADETHVWFTRDSLAAEGNGRPVDEKGWERLTFLLGAGGDVEAKQDGIGAKNHGLRSCFALGDEIVFRSAGLRTSLTLAVPGTKRRRISPGALEHPVPDPEAPQAGARIEVPYRRKPLMGPTGADTGLPVPGADETEQMFRAAVEQAPTRFLGCVRPGIATRYVLTLEHWQLGTCVLTYRCGPRRKKGRLRGFRRECEVRLPGGQTETITEEAVLFQPRGPLRIGRVPRFYRGHSGVLCEVAWATGPGGQPVARPGRMRYPIGYAADASNARTETGASFSAPFISDTTRHGLAHGANSQNEPLVAECERTLVRVLHEYLLPVYGVGALAVLHDPERPLSDRSRRLVAAAADAGALPAATRAGARPGTTCVPVHRDGRRSFLIPAFRRDDEAQPTPLPELAPRDWVQLHPRVPKFVRRALLDLVEHDMNGVPFITFDDYDVIARLRGRMDTGAWFPWSSEDEWRRDLANPVRARLYLDALSTAMAMNSLSDADIVEVREHGHLPDRQGVLRPWVRLWRHKGEMPEIPGVVAPWCVHPLLEDHPLLVRSKLAVKTFKVSDYVTRADFSRAGSAARAAFFAWLFRGERELSGDAMEYLRGQPIWPTAAGEQVTFDSLCAPQSAVRRIMGTHLHVPAPSVLSIRRVRTDGRGQLRLRTRPDAAELRAWWDAALGPFPLDRPLEMAERQAWRHLEGNLVILRADPQLRAEMPWSAEVPGLCADGWLRSVGSVHLPGPTVDACQLLLEDRLVDSGPGGLYAQLGAKTRPSSKAVVRALAGDPHAQGALFPRLAALEAARRADDPPATDISAIPFLEIEGRLYAPGQVALRSSRDYWGAWRVAFPADQLSAERQNHLRAAGVAGRVPDAARSREFFTWLSRQDESVIESHLDVAMRHLLHADGPLGWWNTYPSVPCLPVLTHGRRVRLLSRKEAFALSNAVLLPDFAALERQVLARDRRRRVVITDTEGVQDSVMSRLLDEGLRTLRQLVMPPVAVRAGSAGVRDEALSARLAVVTRERFAADLKKRLQEMHIPGKLVRLRWLHDVRSLQEVRVVPDLEACFRLGKHDYWLPVSAVADVGGGKVLWVSADITSPVDAFYVALAERVFEAGAPSYLAFALQAAVAAGYEARVEAPRGPQRPGPDVEEETEEEKGDKPADDRSQDVRRAHGMGKADQMPNQPNPSPVPPKSAGADGQTSRKARRQGANRPESPEEKAAIDELKEKHYAWHCQVCLAAASPAELAPPGSYAHRPLHRRAFVVGHHVDQVQGGGARWVSNVIVLCQYHHRQLGDQFEYPAIARALAAATPRTLAFAAPGEEPLLVEGVVAEVTLDSEPYRGEIFFTLPHGEAWQGI